MRCVVQRVSRANVKVEGKLISEIGKGYLVLLGVEQNDTEKDAVYIADKIAKLRVFEDENRKMNLSIKQIEGEVLLVSQFTLLGDARGQNRPSFIKAARPEIADELYNVTAERLKEHGIVVKLGQFQAFMDVSLVNDGPVTILLDSNILF